ncbi:protein-glutamine gamma-glutamyltransferase E-like [Pseudophryne corroboree]|uniref:protein-glutamine gamma-glutamyltransferase E-like n=1 Tax=Pseudophryne corroboree TaxID=495146 RepID=UPI0030812967
MRGRRRRGAAPAGSSSSDLQVTSTEWYRSFNVTNHRTDAYDSTDIILRRGNAFTITVSFSRPLQPGENFILTAETGMKDSSSIIASTPTVNLMGPSPSETSKTKAVFPLNGSENKNSWNSVLTSNNSNAVTMTINSPPDAVIGLYYLHISSNTNNTLTMSPKPIGRFYLLFNPWAQGDDVFLADESQRQEYVLNEKGVIFMGSENEIVPLPWCYNQFERSILEICFAILDRSINYHKDPNSDVAQRNDPLYVCRILIATLNSKDENGVLVENWSGFYDDGTSPTSWNGSPIILKDWYYKEYKPVKYGQCWVYGGVLCTVLRCLGIPARVVTNFNSAHDKNANLFIDMLYDSHGAISVSQQDMVWNFHVWNEAWIARKDLGPSYNGWQAMDSTPLETSDDIYRCGPAPLVAIKEGDVDLKYDVGFMFASVNADLSHWINYSDGTKKILYNDTKYIGRYISTKAVGTDDRVDVTDTYKYPEGSLKERELFEKAINKLLDSPLMELEKKVLQFRKKSDQNPKHGTILSAAFTVMQIPTLGQDLNMILSLKNLTTNNITVTVNMISSSILYTGKHKHEIWADTKALVLGPNQEIHTSIPLTYAQYGQFVSEDTIIRMTALCEVQGTEERILVEKDINLGKPPIVIKLPDKIMVNTAFNAEVVITNTLSEVLNSCSLVLEGCGLVDGFLNKALPPLKPGEQSVISFTITPFKIGNSTLITTFSCDKIRNVKQSQKVFVAGAP